MPTKIGDVVQSAELTLKGGFIQLCIGNPKIQDVIFHDPATIIYWTDGTKTVVKCQEGDTYDKKMGFLLCVAKKFFGNRGKYNDYIREHCGEECGHDVCDIWED